MSQFLGEQKIKFHLNKSLLLIIVAMAVLSVTSIYGAQPLLSSANQNLYKQQIFWYVLSIGVVVFLLWFGSDRLFTGIKLFYWVLIAMLSMLIAARFLKEYAGISIPFIPSLNGTYGWFIFFNRISFQPAEFMKVVLIIYTAIIINEHNQTKTEMSFKSDIILFFKVGKICILPVILIFLQPETGIILIMAVSIFMMLAISGIRREWIIGVVIFIIIGYVSVIYIYYNNESLLKILFGSDYKANRIPGWLEPEKYIQFSGYQLYTAQLAYGTAGWMGHGFQSFIASFSEAQNDFIFALITQDFGFYGGIVTIFLCLALDFQLVRIAMRYPKAREKYVVAGILGMLMFQQFQNMAMILGVMPITGITLPFISYGGSSLISYMIPFSIVFNMSSETKNIGAHFR